MKKINFSTIESVVTFDEQKKNNPFNLPEICFAGRSNVGKSSLINSLLNKKKIAKTSNSPGRTQKIFFYTIDKAFIIVDLPGYGFANLSKKKKNSISNLLFDYLTKRIELKNAFLLVDSRHGLKPNDLDFLKMLENYDIEYSFLFTKIDKLTSSKKKQLKVDIENNNFFLKKKIILTSANTKEGIKDLKSEIINLIA